MRIFVVSCIFFCLLPSVAHSDDFLPTNTSPGQKILCSSTPPDGFQGSRFGMDISIFRHSLFGRYSETKTRNEIKIKSDFVPSSVYGVGIQPTPTLVFSRFSEKLKRVELRDKIKKGKDLFATKEPHKAISKIYGSPSYQWMPKPGIYEWVWNWRHASIVLHKKGLDIEIIVSNKPH